MSKKILIIEDDNEILDIVIKRLMETGSQVVSAMTGKGGVDKARIYLPDLILLDIMLPDMDGSDVAKFLQEDTMTRGIPIIFLSGIIGTEAGSPKQIRIGDFTYRALGKPFSFRSLLDAINETIVVP